MQMSDQDSFLQLRSWELNPSGNEVLSVGSVSGSSDERGRLRLFTRRRGLIMNLVQLLYPCLALSPIIKS
jgi:hypothetical protein